MPIASIFNYIGVIVLVVLVLILIFILNGIVSWLLPSSP